MLFDEMEFGPYDKAEQKARKAFELYEDGKMSQALDELETALDINPACGSLHFNKALTLDAIGRFDEAITEYEAALQLNPDDLEILNSRLIIRARVSTTWASTSSSTFSSWIRPLSRPTAIALLPTPKWVCTTWPSRCSTSLSR
ncbi:MAG: tetratricopeptide repeat protein [Planctomycetota bacterium]|jgi:tetratricopeptide (TPR) repeat protein